VRIAGISFDQRGLACTRRRKGVRVVSIGVEIFLVLAHTLRDLDVRRKAQRRAVAIYYP